jgi:two-component system sensor histidine kinase TctE
MKRLSIRGSLTAWFVGSTIVLLAASSLAFWVGLDRALRSGLDDSLRARAETIAVLCEWEGDLGRVEFEFSDELARRLAAGREGHGLEVWGWPGGRLHGSGAPLAAPPPPDAVQPAPFAFATLDTNDAEPRRVCTHRAHRENADGSVAFDVAVSISESLRPIERQLARAGWLVLLFAGGAAAIAVAFGALVSRRLVRPLRSLETAAAAVQGGARAPMPRRGSGDELDRLAQVLDDAFGSLHEALERQARFTADAAHELRNPIAVIHNAADVALRQERTGAQYREFLADVLATARRLADVVDALLLLARMDAGALRGVFADVDLSVLARDAVGGDRRVRVEGADDTVVRAEPRLLRVLIDNLLSNALRYAGPTAPVELVVKNGGPVTLAVRDRGPGIPAAARQRIFDRFYRVSSADAGDGAGLGLAIVAEVARVHGAALGVDSSAAGTCVTVTFPAHREPAAAT